MRRRQTPIKRFSTRLNWNRPENRERDYKPNSAGLADRPLKTFAAKCKGRCGKKGVRRNTQRRPNLHGGYNRISRRRESRA